ncbi:ribosome maturation factor RimP [Abyssibacter profundi]|uniref:ribosome maturation factor RimP n=1 Tax=Abyssibacter profundi TaxID=2182787 RepID=UPI001A9C33B0|nr:ribosome maturation factor RimP [Abyssibacter profundi]
MQRDLTALIEPVVESLGYELVWLQLAGGDGEQILRLYIDHADGIGLGDCERVSREVSALMDVEDPISGHYTLEVSSPGLDRPLVKPQHFDAFVGWEIKLRLVDSIEGRKRFRGQLMARDDETIEMTVDGELHRFALRDIDTARLVPEE